MDELPEGIFELMHRKALTALVASLLPASLAAQAVSIRVLPDRPLIERSSCCLLINFDFELTSSAVDTLEIDEIQATLLDARGTVLNIRRVQHNGMGPSITTLNQRKVVPGRITTVYNPFFSIDPELPVATIRYVFRLRGPGGFVEGATAVSPVPFETKTDLILPLRGRVLVHDGHDFYSHHRRMDLSVLRELGVSKQQFNRYAYDFTLVDSAGRPNRTGGHRNEDWFGYGTEVVAPGAGTVRVAVNTAAEHVLPDSHWDDEAGARNPTSIPGNYVVIDHGNGECSFLAHLQNGSVTVKVGDRVARGQPIARMGLSGDSYWLPHVHYQLMNSCDFQDAEGLPSYFSGFVRAGGTTLERRGQIDTGDIVVVK